MRDNEQNFLTDICTEIANWALAMYEDVRQFYAISCQLLKATRNAICKPRQIRWGDVGYYMDSCGSDAVLIISLLGFLIGVILSFQAIMQLRRYGVESYVVNLVSTVLVTELAPLVTAVVIAGRTGSSFAAELGTMRANEEIDAMVTMGFDTGRFLLFPKVLALLFIMPGLNLLSDTCGIFGGMIIVCSKLQISTEEYWSKTFEIIQWVDLLQGMIKSVAFAGIIAIVGCLKGMNADRNAQGVGRSATSAVVTSIFLIVVTDAILTSCFGIAS